MAEIGKNTGIEAMPNNAYQPSFSFANGVLSIESATSEMRLQWGDAILADERPRHGRRQWREFCPEFRILRPPESDALGFGEDGSSGSSGAQCKADAFDAFRRCIPDDLLSAIERFPGHQWALLRHMHQYSTFRDLRDANPVLAFCLANAAEIRRMSERSAKILAPARSHMKQKAILQWLGFPGTTAAVHLFRKIREDACMPYVLHGLREALSGDKRTLKLLSHLRAPNVGTIALASSPHCLPHVTPKLLEEIEASEEECDGHHTTDLLEEAILLMARLHDTHRIPRFQSIRRIVEFHETVLMDYEAHLAALARAERERREQEKERQREQRRRARETRKKRLSPDEVEFPPPPLPGIETLVPIQSVPELRQEGQRQHNCVGSYWRRVAHGEIYVYRVLAPERATLSIKCNASGNWCRDELKASHNRRVQSDTRRHVDWWLYTYCVSA